METPSTSSNVELSRKEKAFWYGALFFLAAGFGLAAMSDSDQSRARDAATIANIHSSKDPSTTPELLPSPEATAPIPEDD